MGKTEDAFKKVGSTLTNTANQAGSAITNTADQAGAAIPLGSVVTAFNTLGANLNTNVAQPANRTLGNLPRDVMNAGLTVAKQAPGIVNTYVVQPITTYAPQYAATLNAGLNTYVADPIKQYGPGIGMTALGVLDQVVSGVGAIAFGLLGAILDTVTGMFGGGAAGDMTTPLLLAGAGVALMVVLSQKK